MATKRGKPKEQRLALGEDLRIGRVDASLVAKVDAAGLQALAACAARWRADGISWRWEQPAEPLKSAARQAGLEAALGLE